MTTREFFFSRVASLKSWFRGYYGAAWALRVGDEIGVGRSRLETLFSMKPRRGRPSDDIVVSVTLIHRAETLAKSQGWGGDS